MRRTVRLPKASQRYGEPGDNLKCPETQITPCPSLLVDSVAHNKSHILRGCGHRDSFLTPARSIAWHSKTGTAPRQSMNMRPSFTLPLIGGKKIHQFGAAIQWRAKRQPLTTDHLDLSSRSKKYLLYRCCALTAICKPTVSLIFREKIASQSVNDTSARGWQISVVPEWPVLWICRKQHMTSKPTVYIFMTWP